MNHINPKAIVEISQKTPTAEDFFTYAACRERNVREGASSLPATRAQLLKEGFSPVAQDLLLMFRELERAGVGRLLGDKFHWNIPIKRLADIVVDKTTVQEKPINLEPRQLLNFKSDKKTLVMIFADNREVTVSYSPGVTKEAILLLAERLLQECK